MSARPTSARLILIAGAIAVLPPTSSRAQTLPNAGGALVRADSTDWSAVDAAMGRKGVEQPGGVHRYNFPRGDLKVTVASSAGPVVIRPALALGGWVAMRPVIDGVIAMGDLVLAENEIAPVITRLQAGGVEQTAIHHHLLHESPRVYYVHVHAHGDAAKIAAAVRAAVALTRTPPATPPAASASAIALDLDTLQLTKTLGYAGRANGGVWQVAVPRAESVEDGGVTIPSSMGLATSINFQPTGGGKAAVTGDFVMIAREVNPVIRALRDGGIEVTALHNHLLTENPRLFFMHFWANDDVVKLARTLRAALEKTSSKRPAS